jgi:hypothetical protein
MLHPLVALTRRPLSLSHLAKDGLQRIELLGARALQRAHEVGVVHLAAATGRRQQGRHRHRRRRLGVLLAGPSLRTQPVERVEAVLALRVVRTRGVRRVEACEGPRGMRRQWDAVQVKRARRRRRQGRRRR